MLGRDSPGSNAPALGFPTTREELFGYDVVICSDIARAAFTQEQLDWTVELVGKRGGGFAMIGGNTSFGSGGWDQTVWDGLIPVDMSGRGHDRSEYFWGICAWSYPAERRWTIRSGRSSMTPSAIVRCSPRCRLFTGSNLIDRLKPAATALGLSQMPFPARKSLTVFSCQTFGRGRTFAMSTDTTVDWGRDFENQLGRRG